MQVAGKSNGRNERDRGEMGVIRMVEMQGCTIGPPDESE